MLTRRKVLSGVSGAAVLMASQPAWSVVNPPPNIVVIIADDLPMTAYVNPEDGNFTGFSTFLRKHVSGEGAPQDFTDYRSFYAKPECDPARASLFSGQEIYHHGVLDNTEDDVWDDTHTFFHALSLLMDGGNNKIYPAAGWFGKVLANYQGLNKPLIQPEGITDFYGFVGLAKYWGYYLNQPDPNNVGGRLKVYHPQSAGDDQYETDFLTARARDFITANASSPFTMCLAFHNPHEPAVAAPRDTSKLNNYKSGGSATQLPIPRAPDFDVIPTGLQTGHWLNSLPPINQTGEDNTLKSIAKAAFAVDTAVQSIYDTLNSLGILDNTILIVTSDQGFHIGEKRWTVKRTAYQPTVHCPLAIRWPSSYGVPTGEAKESQATDFTTKK